MGIEKVRVLVGCAGFAYNDWLGPFYPKELAKKGYLPYYARYFDFTELNNTFYQPPTTSVAEMWAKATPDDFKFAIKVWQGITHKISEPDLEGRVGRFFSRVAALVPKTVKFLLQFPPRYRHSEKHVVQLNQLLRLIPERYPLAVELRDNSWLISTRDGQPPGLEMLQEHPNATLVTNYLASIDPTYPPGQKAYYIRMIGDRELEKFDRIQRKQEPIFTDVINRVKDLLAHSPGLEDIFVIFNNHFRGFSPQDVNEFKQRLGLPIKSFHNSKTLLDFLPKQQEPVRKSPK